MIERSTPEATPESKQPSDTKHILDFNPNHLMEPTTDCANNDTDSDVKKSIAEIWRPLSSPASNRRVI